MLVNSWFWDGKLEDRQLAYSQSTKAVNFLRDITPDAGAYVVRNSDLSICDIEADNVFTE